MTGYKERSNNTRSPWVTCLTWEANPNTEPKKQFLQGFFTPCLIEIVQVLLQNNIHCIFTILLLVDLEWGGIQQI